MGLLGLVLLLGSIGATQNRHRAGLAFWISAPVVGFWGAYPESLLWKEGPNGVVGMWLDPLLALPLTALFYLPLYAVLGLVQGGRKGVYLLAGSGLAASFAFAVSEWARVLFPELAAWSIALAAFGAFWWGSYRRGWPRLIPERRPLTHRLAAGAVVTFTVVILEASATFTVVAARSSLWRPDCGGGYLFDRPWRPHSAVFTAKLVLVGHSAKISGRWAGKWAIGRVEEHFGGLPGWPWVLLTNGVFLEDEVFVIDGFRPLGVWTRFLPIVRAGPCTLSQPANEVTAKMELRLLRSPALKDGATVIGCVLGPEPSPDILHLLACIEDQKTGRSEFDREICRKGAVYLRAKPRPLAGARIRVSGASGTTVATTDRDGIYQVGGLQGAKYDLRLLNLPDGQHADDRVAEIYAPSRGALLRRDFLVQWNAASRAR